MTAKLMVAALAAAGALQLCAADPLEGLQFKLDLRAEQTAIGANTVGNALDVSSTYDGVLRGGRTAARKVQQEEVTFTDIMYPWRTCTERALVFPQFTKQDEKRGVKVIDPCAIRFPNSAVKSDSQTFYTRFCWSGSATPELGAYTWLASNGYDKNWSKRIGWCVGVYNPAQATAESEYGYLGWMISTDSGTPSGWGNDPYYRIFPNTWYDLFITLAPKADDATKTTMLVCLVKAGAEDAKPSWTQRFTVTSNRKLTFDAGFSDLRFGPVTDAQGWGEDELPVVSGDTDYAKSFRGKITRAMVWNRVLSEAEMWQNIAGRYGATWNLGVVNGRADEFAATTDSDSVWTASDGWSKVCRELTSEHPTLTITDTVPTSEAGLNKILDIEPILSGASAYPVAVSVNGEKIGEYDLTTDRAIQIPGAVWKNGADGKVTIEIERLAPFTGKLELDAVTLCGGWRMTGTALQGSVSSSHYIGERDAKTIWHSTEVPGYGTGAISFDAYIPKNALGSYHYVFEVKIQNVYGTQPHQFLVNDHVIEALDSVQIDDVLTVKVPDQYLVPGHNVFKVSNVATKYGYVRYSYYQITVKQHRGLMMIVR